MAGRLVFVGALGCPRRLLVASGAVRHRKALALQRAGGLRPDVVPIALRLHLDARTQDQCAMTRKAEMFGGVVGDDEFDARQ